MPRKTNSPSKKRILVKKTSASKPAPRLSRKQTSQISGTLAPRQNRTAQKEIEGKRVLAVCPDCFAVYFDEHWHVPQAYSKATVDPSLIRHELCDACKQPLRGAGTALSGFAGEVVLEGFRNEDDKRELLATVRNLGKKARALDPEHRILRIVDEGGKVKVYTSENQLAASIGKHVDHARKGGKLEIVWSEQDAPVRVRWTAKQV